MDPVRLAQIRAAAAGPGQAQTRKAAAPPEQQAQTRKAAAGPEQAQIRKAAAGLEEALLRQALQAMSRAQLENGGFFGSGAAEGSYQTTFEMLLCESLAQGAPLGLAEKMTEQLSRDRNAAKAAETARDLARDATSAPVFRNFTRAPQVPMGTAEEIRWTATGLPITGTRRPVRPGEDPPGAAATPGPEKDRPPGGRMR